MTLTIKCEEKTEFEMIYDFVREAFATAAVSDGCEQDLVNMLRTSENYIPELALVAIDNGQLVGHIMLTKFAFERMLLLAPLAIKLDYRHQGIGTKLVQRAFELAKQMNYTSVVVLGDPNYYSRFGFRPSINFGITCTNEIPSKNVQIVELQEGALDSVNGTISF
jgi:predicted N-acetyltransferase YhbS